MESSQYILKVTHRLQTGNTLRYKKAHITLVEILIVMAVILLIAGVVGVKSQQVLAQQRFRTEVSLVVDKLRLAQELMLVLNTDVHVKFSENASQTGMQFWLEVDSPLTKDWEKILKRVKGDFKAIHEVDFDPKMETPGALDIKFVPNCGASTRGILNLYSNREKSGAKSVIPLQGYPSPIDYVENPDPSFSLGKEDDDFNERLTILTRNEVNEALQKR